MPQNREKRKKHGPQTALFCVKFAFCDLLRRLLRSSRGGDKANDRHLRRIASARTDLEDLGVTPIEAVGQEFDPNLHNAVMHAEDEELGENIVAEEVQKGYKYKDTVRRHSMVKVAN